MTDLNPEKLTLMLREWRGVLKERGRLVERLRHDLKALEAQDKKADVSAVLAFYESVRLASSAAGKVELLEELCRFQGESTSSPDEIQSGSDQNPVATKKRFTL